MILEQSLDTPTQVSYTYYTFRHRCVQMSEHNKPEGRLYTAEEALTHKNPEIQRLGKQLKDWDWSGPCWSSFGCGLKTDIIKGNTVKVNPEPHEVWCKTRSEGYWTLEYAEQALAWLRERNEKGEMDHTHAGCVYQRARYEFRIVKVIHVPDVWVEV